MKLPIPPDLEEYVKEKVASGQFDSSVAFAVEALRVYRELEIHRQRLYDDVDAAAEQSRQGLSTPLDITEVMAEGRRRLAVDKTPSS